MGVTAGATIFEVIGEAFIAEAFAAEVASAFVAEAFIADAVTGLVLDAATGAVVEGLVVDAVTGAIVDAATGAVIEAGAAATTAMPEAYWSMLAENSAAGVPSAAAGTMGGAVESVLPATYDEFTSKWYESAFPQSSNLVADPASEYTFDKFIKGITDNPIRSALSAGQILSGISTANKAMSPEQARAMADPFSSSRQQYVNQLNAVMANPSLAMSQPGYQFQRQQGEQAIDRKLAARGMGSYTPDGRGSASGGADIARMKYGQEYALGSYNDYVKQLSGLAGATQAPGVGGQAALSAQAAAAAAATQGWGAINQGIGTMDKLMRTAGNPVSSYQDLAQGGNRGYINPINYADNYGDMPSYSGNVPSNDVNYWGSSSNAGYDWY